MKLSRTGTYALYGVSYLAARAGQRVTAKEVAEVYDVPEARVAKVFQLLVRAGLLTSSRGSNGGFALSRPAESISLLDVVDAIEAPRVDCLLHDGACDTAHECPVLIAWDAAHAPMRAAMQKTSMKDVAWAPSRPPRRAPLVRIGSPSSRR